MPLGNCWLVLFFLCHLLSVVLLSNGRVRLGSKPRLFIRIFELILFDSTSNKVAIPVETPLPRLLSEAIMLLSGLAPDFKEIDGKKYRVYENVFGIFTQNLFRLKLGQKAINKTL